MTLGPVMVGVQSFSLSEEEREMLAHPNVGGVILFTRNYDSIEQLTQLIQDIHQIKAPPLLVAVDHEGGRVQRFRRGFTRIPAKRIFGELYNFDKPRAKRMAEGRRDNSYEKFSSVSTSPMIRASKSPARNSIRRAGARGSSFS